MRHRKKTIKLGRTSSHREALMASLVCHLISVRRIETSLAKAKAARSLAEKMVTLAKKGSLAARRQAIATLHRKEFVATLFDTIAPACKDRAGGYTRIIKLGQRTGDNAELALLEWVDLAAAPTPKKKKKKAEAAEPAAGAEEKPAGKADKPEKAAKAEKKPKAKPVRKKKDAE